MKKVCGNVIFFNDSKSILAKTERKKTETFFQRVLKSSRGR